MGKSSSRRKLLSKTLPSSPSHSFSSSSSSSDFEFTISLSTLKSSSSNLLCPADELFYKGQLLPLHLSPRLSMVRTLLLSPTRTSTDTDTTASSSRDSNGSTNDSHSSFGCELLGNDCCDSSRPSSVSAELEDEFRRLSSHREQDNEIHSAHSHQEHQVKKPKYFSLSRFSSVFRKDQTKINRQVQQQVVVAAAQHHGNSSESASSVKKGSSSSSSSSSSSAKDVIRKYLKKVKPLYERLSSQKQQEQKMDSVIKSTTSRVISLSMKSCNSSTEGFVKNKDMAGSLCSSSSLSSVISSNKENGNGRFSNSFSGNLRYPRKRSNNLSCPSSIRSSPNHSGVLCRNKVMSSGNSNHNVVIRSGYNSEASSMNELQNAIQGAIAHCKNSMAQATKTEATEQISSLTVS
ncbi:hypothetical protein MKW98_005002 [Papaver atlanticum]|uniref:Membrane-associated kinase regulator 1 n=1 Tax=Papaver atlanticum TaxID=357466 RepID=A0AAD4TD75_9MAGN|nr:hypothetical protein MKW98_005002 [Papaver atlanticum]